MELIVRRMFQEDDLLTLLSQSDEEAKMLMKWGELRPKIVGRTPVSEKPNASISQSGRLIKSYYSGQVQILFGPKVSESNAEVLKRLEDHWDDSNRAIDMLQAEIEGFKKRLQALRTLADEFYENTPSGTLEESYVVMIISKYHDKVLKILDEEPRLTMSLAEIRRRIEEGNKHFKKAWDLLDQIVSGR